MVMFEAFDWMLYAPLLVTMFIVVIISTIFFILLDELIMSCAQRRIGPDHLGGYGIISSLINGCNLIISQFLVPKLHFHFGFQSFPVLFLLISLSNYLILYPFFLVDLSLSLIILILWSGFSILFIIFSSFSGGSHYSMLGCYRIISQLISFELILSTVIIIFIFSYGDLSISLFFLLMVFIILGQPLFERPLISKSAIHHTEDYLG